MSKFNFLQARRRSTAWGRAVFVSASSDRAHGVETGRCCERLAPPATALGIRNGLLNPPVDAGSIRPQFAGMPGPGTGKRPDLVVRFGRGPTLPLSMRRPVLLVLT